MRPIDRESCDDQKWVDVYGKLFKDYLDGTRMAVLPDMKKYGFTVFEAMRVLEIPNHKREWFRDRWNG